MWLEPAHVNISIWLEGVTFHNTNSYICKVFLILIFSLSISNFHWMKAAMPLLEEEGAEM